MTATPPPASTGQNASAPYTLHHGDCLDVLRGMPDNSVDSIVCDPPYGLSDHRPAEVLECLKAWIAGEPYIPKGKGFMGKKWDAWVPGPEVWRECLRVVKPGGHLLAFAGTRSMDLMSMAVRLAGFELRDSIGYAHDGGDPTQAPIMAWVSGSGFPKSADVSNKIDQHEQNKWIKISKSIDGLSLAEITELWINSQNASAAGLTFRKSQTEAGFNTQRSVFAHGHVLLQTSHKNCDARAVIAELSLIEVHPTNVATCFSAQSNAEGNITALKSRAITAGSLQESREATLCTVDFSALQHAWGWQSGSKVDKLKAVEALKTWLGRKPSSKMADTSALCAALTDDLKLITLSQSKTFLSFDTTRQMDCVFAISATITESTAESLISFTANTLKIKAIDKAAGAAREVVGEIPGRWTGKGNALNFSTDRPQDSVQVLGGPVSEAAKRFAGWGTALKPSFEPIILARKPLIGTVAATVLAHGTGGLNIDACRIPTDDKLGGGDQSASTKAKTEGWARPWMQDAGAKAAHADRVNANVERAEALGRWPANLIHDGSPEVVALFPVTGASKAGGTSRNTAFGRMNDDGWVPKDTPRGGFDDAGGSAARYFYCAKASKRDRSSGMGFEYTLNDGVSVEVLEKIQAELNQMV